MQHHHMTEALAEERRHELHRASARDRRFDRRSRRPGWVKRALRTFGS